jgi:hypothetical protein
VDYTPVQSRTSYYTLLDCSLAVCSLEFVSTYSTFLSSRCLCGARKKKKTLSERKHFCGCEYVPEGTFVDRDEFSAFLAMFSQESL